MSHCRIARNGAVLGDFTPEQIAEGALAGNFQPTDDALQEGATVWVKLVTVPGVQFPKLAFPPPPAQSAPPPPLPSEYSGIYRSSDEKILVGLCGGLAHKLGFNAGVVRFVLVLTWVFTYTVTFWIYWFALLLPKLPTKYLPR